MPKKSVREMTDLERQQNSLGTRTFNTILCIAVIISVAAVVFGYFLYSSAVRREYRSEAWQNARITAGVLSNDDVRAKAREVLSVYDEMTEEEKADPVDEVYLDKFSFVRDKTFEGMRAKLHTMESGSKIPYVYIGAIDPERLRMIYIVDSDVRSTFCPPGKWDELDDFEYVAYTDSGKATWTDKIFGDNVAIPAAITNSDEYGQLCTGASYILTVDGYDVYAFVDINMRSAYLAIRTFLVQFIVLLVLVSILTGILFNKKMKKDVVEPVNRLSGAALAYVRDKKQGKTYTRHFSELDIHTGDEVENLSLIMQDMETDLAEYENNLEKAISENERINTELNLAAQIQEGMIPHIYPAFPDRLEFDIYASMNAAKEVGGDFYDFFLLDDDHLVIVMADVSGKGVPAALFMMASKIMLQNFAVIDKYSPAKILRDVNEQICTNNSVEMFVTVWLGILEISTGMLTAANAGHEYPVFRQNGGAFELYKDKHGFVLGGMDGIAYSEYQVQLKPGDMLFQYTDGVTEAANPENELFGTNRMLDALNSDPEADPTGVLMNMADAISGFTREALQFDDITMLCLRYNGAGKGEEA